MQDVLQNEAFGIAYCSYMPPKSIHRVPHFGAATPSRDLRPRTPAHDLAADVKGMMLKLPVLIESDDDSY